MKQCQITGKRSMVGNHVSHAKNRVKRKFGVNLIQKRFFVPSKNEWITLKISASTLRTINKIGLEKTLGKHGLSL